MLRFLKFALPAAAVAFSACAVAVDRSPTHPLPDVRLVQVVPDWRVPVVWGPLDIEYDVVVSNPTDHALLLRRIDLVSDSSGQYRVARQSRRLRTSVPPHRVVATRIRVAAWATGGEASAYEPVVMRGELLFDTSERHRHRVAFECIP